MTAPFGDRSLRAMREFLDIICAVPAEDRWAYATMLTAHAAEVSATSPMLTPDGAAMTGTAWSVALTARLAALLDATADDQPDAI